MELCRKNIIRENATKAAGLKVSQMFVCRIYKLIEQLWPGCLVALTYRLRMAAIRNRVFYTLILFTVLSSCEETIDKQFDKEAPLRLVVDAILTNQPGESYVKLSLPVAGPNDQLLKVSGAVITVSDGKNTVILTEDLSETGTYKPDYSIRGVTGKNYRILIKIGEYIDSAFTYIVPVSPLNTFEIYEDGARPGYYFISGENSGDPAIIQYSINPADCQGKPDCRTIIYEYILSSFDVPQIFSPQKETLSFPSGSKVIRKKYSLNPEYEAYIRAFLSETEWRGGLFDVQPGNPKGNFGNFTLGYFAGCSLVMDTVYIEQKK
jgi:hypothetical protein